MMKHSWAASAQAAGPALSTRWGDELPPGPASLPSHSGKSYSSVGSAHSVCNFFNGCQHTWFSRGVAVAVAGMPVEDVGGACGAPMSFAPRAISLLRH